MAHGNGKIANLPSEIREELNWRMNDGDAGNELVQWLNAKPEVIEVMRERFDGRAISEQNLSEWRNHGYKKWLAFHIALDESQTLSENSEVIAETGIDCDKLILTLTASYAAMIQRWNITPMEEMAYKIEVFKNLTQGVIALRRAELQKLRVEIQRERLELLRERQRNKSASAASSVAASSAENKVAAASRCWPDDASSSAVSPSADSPSAEAGAASTPERPTPSNGSPQPKAPLIPQSRPTARAGDSPNANRLQNPTNQV